MARRYNKHEHCVCVCVCGMKSRCVLLALTLGCSALLGAGFSCSSSDADDLESPIFFSDVPEFEASATRARMLSGIERSECQSGGGCGFREAVAHMTSAYRSLEQVRRVYTHPS